MGSNPIPTSNLNKKEDHMLYVLLIALYVFLVIGVAVALIDSAYQLKEDPEYDPLSLQAAGEFFIIAVLWPMLIYYYLFED